MFKSYLASKRKALSNRIYKAKSLLFYSNENPFIRYYRLLYNKIFFKKLQKEEPELYQHVTAILRARGLLYSQPSNKYSDAYFLFHLICQERPKLVLECGAGASTVAIAYALRRVHQQSKQAGLLVSIDDNQEYLERRILAEFPASLQQYVEWHISPVECFNYVSRRKRVAWPGVCYRFLPRRKYDLIYVDGPADSPQNWPQVQAIGKPMVSDYLNLLIEGEEPGLMLLDQRILTRLKMKELLTGPVKMKYCLGARKTFINADSKNVAGLDRHPL